MLRDALVPMFEKRGVCFSSTFVLEYTSVRTLSSILENKPWEKYMQWYDEIHFILKNAPALNDIAVETLMEHDDILPLSFYTCLFYHYVHHASQWKVHGLPDPEHPLPLWVVKVALFGNDKFTLLKQLLIKEGNVWFC
jgi:hypothetical protein